MKSIIFTIRETGHNLEYLHHIYEVCAEKKDKEYVFLIPNKAKTTMSLFSWKNTNNITFDFISDEYQKNCIDTNILLGSWRMSKLLRLKVKEHNAQEVFAITVMSLLPFIGLLVPAKISGIIYSIYLYNWKKSSITRKVGDIFKYILFSKISSFKDILILNDESSACYLNCLYRTDKFKYLPDPYIPIIRENVWDFREKYNIPPNAYVFAHFGSISKRKGTLDILSSIRLLPESVRHNCYYVIAGRVFPNFENSLKKMIDEIKEKNVLFFNEFCSFEFIANLCRSSNAIVMPYLENDRSSGLLGYSSQFKVPVIGPNTGLIGKLIRRYNLGILCHVGCPKDLVRCYMTIIDKRRDYDSQKYIEQRSVESFEKVIAEII